MNHLVSLLESFGVTRHSELSDEARQKICSELDRLAGSEPNFNSFLLADFESRVRFFRRSNDSLRGQGTVLVIGSGLAGLYAALKLTTLGFQVQIVTEDAQVGGTWFKNSYPGSRVDISRAVYPFSDVDYCHWANYYPTAQEMQKYCVHFASQISRADFLFNQLVEKIEWSGDLCGWWVDIAGLDGRERRFFNFVIDCTGQLSRPRNISFLRDFSGETYVAPLWPDSVELKGKKVALIGLGASGIQIASTLSNQVSALHIVSGAAHWIRMIPHLKRGDGMNSFSHKQYAFDLIARAKASVGGFQALVHNAVEAQTEILSACEEWLDNLPEDKANLVRPDYQPGLRRILLDNGDYAECLRKDSTFYHPTHLENCSDRTLRLSCGEVISDVDVIIAATGFDVFSAHFPYDIIDCQGRDRGEKPVLGFGSLCFEALPNFFQVNGYGTNLVLHGAATNVIEIQMAFIGARMLDASGVGAANFEVSPQAVESYRTCFKANHEQLIWSEASEKRGWYWGISQDNPTNLPMTLGAYIDVLKTWENWS